MGILDKLRGGSKEKSSSTQTVEAPPCPHSALLARWDSVEDMGNEDKVDHYWCEACGQNFSAEEGKRLKESEAARLLSLVEEPPATTNPQT